MARLGYDEVYPGNNRAARDMTRPFLACRGHYRGRSGPDRTRKELAEAGRGPFRGLANPVWDMTGSARTMNGISLSTVVEITGSVLEMTGSALEIMEPVLKQTGSVLEMTGSLLRITEFALKMTGSVLKMIWPVLEQTRLSWK